MNTSTSLVTARPVANTSVSNLPLKTTAENGDVICHYLNVLGIEHVFGVPGGSIEPFLNALSRSEKSGGVKFTLTRHEAGAAFIADGYARATNNIGVCCSTSGPGATNFITAVANAFADEVPLLVITAQPKIENFGRGPLQDSSCSGINVVGMFDHCTVYNSLVSHPDQLLRKLLQALSCAKLHSKPVHLSIPADIMRSKVELDYRQSIPTFEVPNANKVATNFLARVVENQKVCVVLGRDCIGSMEAILRVAESKNWTIVSTPHSKGLISEYHYLNRGVLGIAGHESALNSVHEADCVLVLDADFDELSTCGWDEKYLSKPIYYVSPSADKLTRATFVEYALHCSVAQFEKDLNKLSGNATKIEIDESCLPANTKFVDNEKYLDRSSGPVKPQALFWHMSKHVPENYCATFDTGNSWLWGIHYWCDSINKDPNTKTFNVSMGFGSMGWGIGGAIGMAFADRERPVLCFTGDGSFMMHGTELSVAREHNLNVVFVILNDSNLGMVMHGQKLGGAEQLGHSLPEIDFAKMAESMGVESHKINCISRLRMMNFDKIFANNGPVVLDVRIDPEEVPPLGSRMKVLAASSK